jgi:glycogen operon protein
MAGLALAMAGPAAVPLCAAAIGSNHPSTGAYSPVNPSSWGSAGWPLGSTFTSGPGSTLEIGVYSANATEIVLEIYLADTGADAAYDYTMAKGPDNIWRAAVADAPAYTLYAFRAWGPNWPFSGTWARGNSSAGFITDCDSQGNRFNPNKVLFDPYARELSHNTYTPAMQAAGEQYAMYTSGGANISPTQVYAGPLSGGVSVDCRTVDTGHRAPKAVAFVDTTPTGPKPGLNQKDAIIYETHLKGLTAHPSSVNLTTLLSRYSGFQDAADVPDSLRGTYAGAAYMAGYLKDLGFNTVEFLPVHETDNAADPTTAPTTSGGGYWGYYTYGYFAPDRRYSSNQSLGGPTAEFKAMVAAFHSAGIEVYLDVVYNHSGEGGVWDATTAAQAEITFFRGLDNSSYYTLVPGTPQYYWVSTGVGTNVNGGSAPVQQLITDSLTYWSTTMGVDGFRFDEAAELGRNGASAFSGTSPLLLSIAALAGADGFKIIAEPGDVTDSDWHEIGEFPAGWACWNGNYRDSARLYMTGNLTGYVNGAGGLGYADAFYGDAAKMTAEGGPQKSVNYVVSHDGFDMTDLVSYGTPPTSLAWPFGPEQEGGPDNSSSWGGNQTLRRQAIRDFWTFQVLSRGVPMMLWGDEFGRTVDGNNNSYNIDSVATWNNYSMIGTNSPDTVPTGDTTGGTMGYDNNLGTFAGSINANFAFLQYLLHLRAAHAAFRQQDYVSEAITFANADGSSGFSEAATPTAEIYVHGSQVGDDDFLVLSNMATSSVVYTLPAAPAGSQWVRIIDTNSSSENIANSWGASAGSAIAVTCTVGSQSIVVLEGAPLAPRIQAQPVDAVVSAGQDAGFQVSASGEGTLSYQWQELPFGGTAWMNLSDGSGFSGTATATLTVADATPAMSGDEFRAVVTDPYGSTTSWAVLLGVASGAPSLPSRRLGNISTRADVLTGSNIAIPGFVVAGPVGYAKQLLIRAVGPGLGAFGVPGTIASPELVLNDSSGSPIVTDIGWGNALVPGTSGAPVTYRNATLADFASVGAFPLAVGSADSAVVVNVPAGNYTAWVFGAGSGTGVGLAEVYEMNTSDPCVLINISTRAYIGSQQAQIAIPGFVIFGSQPATLLVRGIGPALAGFGVAGTVANPVLEVDDSSGNAIATNTGWANAPVLGDSALVTGSSSTAKARPATPADFSSTGAFPLAAGSADCAMVLMLPPGAYTAKVSGAGNGTGATLVEVYLMP